MTHLSTALRTHLSYYFSFILLAFMLGSPLIAFGGDAVQWSVKSCPDVKTKYVGYCKKDGFIYGSICPSGNIVGTALEIPLQDIYPTMSRFEITDSSSAYKTTSDIYTKRPDGSEAILAWGFNWPRLAVCGPVSDRNSGKPKCMGEGNPIHVATGNKYQSERDYQSSKPFGASLTRHYNSYSGTRGIFGTNWSSTYERRLDAVTTTRKKVLGSDGQGQFYSKVLDVWVPDYTDDVNRLTELANGEWDYVIGKTENIEHYNALGLLVSITDKQGRQQVLEYDSTNHLLL